MVQQKNRKQPHCPFVFEFVFQQKLEWLVARLRRPPGQDKGAFCFREPCYVPHMKYSLTLKLMVIRGLCLSIEQPSRST